ncbi:hypothetical protein OUZ56_008458 [Daphnia magna]|uniref:Uncharacterized protein n=1 Tax=Daphnia magna TaxID=35525 RepID=A0ABR0ADF9_9CRUS|nr:hypothetical protein OUZ56_008458 [Daphnia magna]
MNMIKSEQIEIVVQPSQLMVKKTKRELERNTLRITDGSRPLHGYRVMSIQHSEFKVCVVYYNVTRVSTEPVAMMLGLLGMQHRTKDIIKEEGKGGRMKIA